MMMLFFTHSSPIPKSSSRLKTFPIGLCGVLITIILVLLVIVASSSFKSSFQSLAGHTSVSPFSGGCSVTYLIVPPAISIFEMYWSKKGSMTITS